MLIHNSSITESHIEQLRTEFSDIDIFIKVYQKESKCESCSDSNIKLFCYNYIVNILRSGNSALKDKILHVFGDDSVIFIGGNRFEIKSNFYVSSNKYVPIYRQILGFFRSLIMVVFNAFRKREIYLDKEEVRKRLAICGGCPLYDPKNERCTECGCFVKEKTKYKYLSCPKGKW